MRSAFALLLLSLCAGLAAPAQSLRVDIPYKKFVLKNGLTLIVHEDHKAPIVAVNVWYHVGSKNEKPGKTGFAHLFEHLMFGGSENVRTTYINAFEKIGATDLNGTTNEDRTNYFETVPVTALDYTLFLESDRMGHLLGSFDAKTLETQRGVVQNEKRQGENQPYGLAFDLIPAATYPAGHPYSWTVIGSMDDLNAASLEDVKTWFRTYYGPSNATLVIAGDIDAETAKQKVEKYFGDIPSGPPIVHQGAWVAKMSGVHRLRVQDRVAQTMILKVWNVPQWGSAPESYLSLAAACLTQGKDSRLYRRLVYNDQIATRVNAELDTREIGSQFYIEALVKPGQDPAKVEAAIDEELARFNAGGPTADELERVKTTHLANFVRGLDRVGGFGGKSDVLAQGEVFTGDPDAFRDRLRFTETATAAQIQAAAKQWLSDGELVLTVTPFPKFSNDGKPVDRSKLPEVTSAPDTRLPRLHRAALSNGLKIVVAERHDTPIVDAAMLFDAGYAADQFGNPGTASLAMTLLTDGTRSRNALQISNEQERLGAQLRAGSQLDASTVSLSALKPKLDDSLALFADVILNPSFPDSDFQREKKLMLARIEQEKSDPFSAALRVLPAFLYGPRHAYGNPLTGSGTTASVARITREDLIRFHSTWLKPNAATLIISGDTTLSEIQPKIEKLFGGWRAGEIPKKNLASVSLPEKARVYLIDRPGAVQSYVIAGERTLPKNSPNEIATDLMNDMIGGTFSSRLNMNLREDKHWAYGAHSRFYPAKGQQPFIAYAAVQTDKTKESLMEMSRELRDFAGARPVTGPELQAAIANRTLKLAGSRESLRAVGSTLEAMVEYGYPDDYFDTYSSKVRNLREADIADAAKTVLHPDSLVWVVVGDRAKIEAGIRSANIGELRIIDSNGEPAQ